MKSSSSVLIIIRIRGEGNVLSSSLNYGEISFLCCYISEAALILAEIIKGENCVEDLSPRKTTATIKMSCFS